MSTFRWNEVVDLDRADTTSAALGTDAGEAWGSKEVGKLVALNVSDDSTFELAAEDAAIEGFVLAVEPFTVNNGFSFGTVQKNGRLTVEMGPNQATALVVGNAVVADAQAAVGTAGLGRVKAAGALAVPIWRVIRIVSGTGVTGDKVLIERLV